MAGSLCHRTARTPTSATVRDCTAGTDSDTCRRLVRLDRSIRQIFVAEDAIEIEQVEYQLVILVEQGVTEENRHIIFAAGQVQSAGLIAGIQSVEQVVAPEHALVDVLGGKIEVVVMEPE